MRNLECLAAWADPHDVRRFYRRARSIVLTPKVAGVVPLRQAA